MTQTCPYQKLRSNSFGGVEVPPIVRAGWVRREPIWCVRSTTQKSSKNDISPSRICEEWRFFRRQNVRNDDAVRQLEEFARPDPWLEAESVD